MELNKCFQSAKSSIIWVLILDNCSTLLYQAKAEKLCVSGSDAGDTVCVPGTVGHSVILILDRKRKIESSKPALAT